MASFAAVDDGCASCGHSRSVHVPKLGCRAPGCEGCQCFESAMDRMRERDRAKEVSVIMKDWIADSTDASFARNMDRLASKADWYRSREHWRAVFAGQAVGGILAHAQRAPGITHADIAADAVLVADALCDKLFGAE